MNRHCAKCGGNLAELDSVDCSIIVPVYFNEGSLFATYAKLRDQLVGSSLISDYEIIFIDDGSQDRSFEVLLEIKRTSDIPVRIIKFPRNFGQVSAMMAGYKYARGKCVINISADLQDPPELITEMLAQHLNHNNEVVICTREDRDENWYRKATSKLFYRIMRKLSFSSMPEGGFDFVLISERVKNIILSNEEANPFWQGQILWTGHSTKFIPYTRLKREHGKSRWTFGKKLKYLLDGVLAYSYFPMRAMSLVGIAVFFLGIIYAIVISIDYLYGMVPFKGWAPIMILILVLSGIQMLMLGVIGEYLWRALDQVRKRPLYLIEKVVE
jgi:polyisoprenyl-phosphate glycosyltransferase